MLNNNAVCNGYDAKGYCLFCDVLMLRDVVLMLRNAFLLLEYAVYAVNMQYVGIIVCICCRADGNISLINGCYSMTEECCFIVEECCCITEKSRSKADG